MMLLRIGVARKAASRILFGGRSRFAWLSSMAQSGTNSSAPPPLDFAWLEANAADMRDNIIQRHSPADVDLVLELHQKHKHVAQAIMEVQTRRNALAAEVKNQASARPDPEQIELGKKLKAKGQYLAAELEAVAFDLDREARLLPNSTFSASPLGGEAPRQILSFGPEDHKFLVERMDDDHHKERGATASDDGAARRFRDHMQIAQDSDLIDFECGARVTGSKFYFLKNEAALLEVALTQWALTRLRSRGFTPVTCPDLVQNRIIRGCGFVPRGESSQIYSVEDAELSLAATAEIPLAGMYSDCILEPEQLPLKLGGLSHCFRTEAGSLGRDTHGLYRVHQFTKVEMFGICAPEDSDELFQSLVDTQRELHEELGLHGVQLEMPADELGASAHRKIDTEVWIPSRGDYGEVCSASNCTDYQSRRLGIRLRRDDGRKKTVFAHTLNATACAVPRVLIALLEQHQQPDGSIRIPDALQQFMQGQVYIPAPKEFQ